MNRSKEGEHTHCPVEIRNLSCDGPEVSIRGMDPRIHRRFAKICGAGFFSSVAQGSIAVGKFSGNFGSEVAAKIMHPLPGTKKWCFFRTRSRQCRPFVHQPSKRG
ncbi:hypothetical protein CEXT_384791 [Caerostris extrusa]|uniref:Uncharacterized protein n=1 Tax=Caerostris extrusa TaxID=172846 RepID=A0AAV4RWM5_CAEEX|nr:hypothetical protein CEXT_384791 [Caerostris extrusa]